jgi:syntaxin 5
MGMYVSMSSGRDRTSEFVAIADRLRKSSSATSSLAASVSSYGSLPYGNGTNGGAYHAAGDGETARLLSSSGASSTSAASEFNKRASQIGLGIHQTSQKLSKLAKCE